MIQTSRNQQILLQAYFFNKGCSITMHNIEKRMTMPAKQALKDLVDKKALSYERVGKAETFMALLGRKDVEHGKLLTEEDDALEIVSPDIDYAPLFKAKKVN